MLGGDSPARVRAADSTAESPARAALAEAGTGEKRAGGGVDGGAANGSPGPRKRWARIDSDSDEGDEHGDDSGARHSGSPAQARQQQPAVVDDLDETALQTMDVDAIVAPIIKQELTADLALLLTIFYKRLFPFKEMHQWLSYGNVDPNYFTHREFSFTQASDAYIRFQSYKTADELKSEILRLCPVKIDIGAVYNVKPKDARAVSSSAFVPLERELVFDVDMTDYDEIRTCCKGAEVCGKCWNFMSIAIKVVDRAMREDFGFKHILWVFSGRRGVHCWVADQRARKLTAEARRAIVSYLEVVKGGENMAKKVNLRGAQMHPSISSSYTICSKYFVPVLLEEMKILSTQERWAKVLQLIPDESIRRNLDAAWKSHPNATDTERWNQLKAALAREQKPMLNTISRDILLQYTYPRLDAHVSIGMNHLLKSPFCVHPKTGRVCVPIDPKACDKFDPSAVPTIEELVHELDKIPAGAGNTDGSSRTPDYEHTSLKPYIDMFKRDFLAGMGESIRSALRAKREDLDKELTF
ncbi:p48 polypeptide of DNA primase [Polyrhizophydium stewartii]|uniref:DNA primase n=1 Tax=Polyrhizophydium stewartii TaxID=2732419 RepID=A0ABR4NEQ6_9FUNG|nr:hypothetical protein HK105_001746 [Polyrhizophydium stewartii]